MNIKIGYQGLVGSNSEEAAKAFKVNLGLPYAELVPLKSSRNVVLALSNEEINYGVMAIENSIGGIVEESKQALESASLLISGSLSLPIHHSMFFRDENITNEDIETVASHVQALKQSSNLIESEFGKSELLEMEDTAIAAKMLANGDLNNNTAIICRKNAGEMYKLYLYKENIENDSSNQTTFHIYELAKII